MIPCGITFVLPGKTPKVTGSFIWMDNLKALELTSKKIIRYQLAEQLSLDKTKIKSEGALKSEIALGRVR